MICLGSASHSPKVVSIRIFQAGVEVASIVGVLLLIQVPTNIQVKVVIASILRLEVIAISRVMADCRLDSAEFMKKIEVYCYDLKGGSTQNDFKDFCQLLCTIFYQEFFFEWEVHH